MLSIKAPLETVLKPDFLHTNESFYERISGNYRQMGQTVNREDLIHVVTQPPEVFLMGNDMPQTIGQTDIRNTQIQKVEVLNQLINRIMIAADGHLTYQDEVYITNALHKFGVQNHQAFMRQVYRLTQDTKNTNRLLASYQTNINRLSELVYQFATTRRDEQRTEIANVENEILHLHEEVSRRWQAGDLYRMQQSFRQSSEGRTTISREMFQMAEQIRLSQQLRLQELRETARGEFVPLVYHHENIFEGAQEESLPLSEERIEQKIASAVLLSLVDNLYQSVYEQVDHALENWYHTEYAFYEAGANVFARMEGNTSLRQLFYEQSALSVAQQNANSTELAMIEELVQLTEENNYLLQETNEGEHFSPAEISYLSQSEETEETTENLLEKNTYEQQVYQQNIQNERRQREYLSNLQRIVEGFRAPTGEDAGERTKQETLFALEHPEAFRRQYAEAAREEEDRREAAMEESGSSEQGSMSEVIMKGLKKVYDGGVTAVHDVNLHIADKEFIVLVGPSGCGKSTTLRMVAGLEDISGGELYIDGKLVNDVEPKDRDIAMVFQSYALYPHMTVRDNLGFALKLKKVPKEEIEKKVNEVAEILDITQYLDRKPKALSGGQRQRVAIGRAMVRDPKVFLMDEPLSNLDAKLRNQMRAEIIKLRQRINTTFMYVTHDQTEAMTLGDRIVIMKDGFVNQIGTPQEVFDKPVNLFVAGFIGMPVMNFFDGCKLLLEGGKYYAEIRGVKFELSEFQQKALKQNNQQPCDIVAGIRPQHISVGEGELSAVIEVSEMLGSEYNLHARSGDDEVVMVIPTVGLEEDVSMGSKVHFSTKPELIQLFDKASGLNLIWYDKESAEANAPVCKSYDF